MTTESKKQPLPEWFTETPDLPPMRRTPKGQIPPSHGYMILMTDHGSGLQDIEIDREEYIAVKRFIATRRGLFDGTVMGNDAISVAKARDLLEKANAWDVQMFGAVLEGQHWVNGPLHPMETFIETILRSYAYRSIDLEDVEKAVKDLKRDARECRWIVNNLIVRDKWILDVPTDEEEEEEPAAVAGVGKE